jgi:hypothetical protein
MGSPTTRFRDAREFPANSDESVATSPRRAATVPSTHTVRPLSSTVLSTELVDRATPSASIRVCLVACVNSDSLSHLSQAVLRQVDTRYSHVFGSPGLLKQAELRCCLAACLS